MDIYREINVFVECVVFCPILRKFTLNGWRKELFLLWRILRSWFLTSILNIADFSFFYPALIKNDPGKFNNPPFLLGCLIIRPKVSKERSVIPRKQKKILSWLAISIFVLANLVLTDHAGAAITLSGIATTGTTTTTILTINKPVGVAVGDIMIINIAQGGNNATSPFSTGWILIDGQSLGGGIQGYGALLYRVVDGLEGTNFNFTLGVGTNSAVGAIVAFSGVDGSTPFDVASGVISVQSSQTSVFATGKTTVSPNDAVIMFGMAAGDNPTWSGWTTTSPGTLTELYDAGNVSNTKATVGAAWELKATAGATGDGGATLSGNVQNGGILITLRAMPCTVPSQPSIISGSAIPCENQNENFSVSNLAGVTYTWTLPVGWTKSGGGSTNSISALVGAGAGNITVVPSNACGNGIARILTISAVYPNSVGGVTSTDQTICQGSIPSDITLSGQTGTIQWQSSADNVTFSNIPGATSSPLTSVQMGALTTTRYYRTMVTNGVCPAANSNVVTVTVHPTPTVTAPIGLTYCNGVISAPFVLSGTPANVTYDISGGAAIGLNDQTGVPAIPAFTPITGSATVTVIPKANGCTGSSVSFVVTVRPTPTGTIGGGVTVCQNSTPPDLTFNNPLALPILIHYNINGSGDYLINILGNASVSIPIPTNLAGTFNYNLVNAEYLTAPNCTNAAISGSSTVNVLPAPIATISGTTTVCQSSIQPNITISNPQVLPVMVTFSINGVTQPPINIPASSSGAVAVSTTSSGVFSYDLVSIAYQGSTGCLNTISGNAVVTVRSTPTATIGGGTTVCQNSPRPMITFTNPQPLSITASYTINNGIPQIQNIPANQTISIPVNTPTAGIFTYKLESIQYTTVPNCLNLTNLSETVVVLATPTASISGTTTVCQNGNPAPNITFTNPQNLPIAVTYAINGVNQAPVTINGNSSATVPAATAAAGVFSYDLVSVAYQGSPSCSGAITGIAVVTVLPTPVVTSSGGMSACLNSSPSPNLVVSNPQTIPVTVSYNINGGATLTIKVPAGSSSSVPVSTVATGSYTYKVVGAQYTPIPGCNNPLNLSSIFDILPVPTATMSGTATVCPNDPQPVITISNTQALPISVTYAINGSNQPTININGASTATVSAPTNVPGIFTYNLVSVAYQGGAACPNTTTGSFVTITVNALPASPTAGNNGPVCIGTPLSLTATTISGATYSWTGPNGFFSSLQNPTVSANASIAMSGTYSVTATKNGCPGLAGTTVVSVNSIPSAPTAGNNGPVCVGSPLSLTVSAIVGATYNWTGSNGYASSLQNPTVSASATAVMAGTYNVTVTVNGCTSPVASTMVVVTRVPVISNQSINSCNKRIFTISPESGVPAGTYVPAGTTYSWTAPTGTGFTGGSAQSNQISISQTLSLSNATVGATAIYTVTPQSNGCNGIPFTATVMIVPNPPKLWTMYFQGDTTTVSWSQCAGQSGEFFNDDLDVYIQQGGVPTRPSTGSFSIYDSYHWQYSFESPTGPWEDSPVIAGTFYQHPMNQLPAPSIFTRIGDHYFRYYITQNGCTTYSNVITLHMVSSLSVNPGGPLTTICSASPAAITLTGASVTGAPTPQGQWSIESLEPTNGGANGTLSSTALTSTPSAVTYTPPANYAGTVTLKLTTNDPDGAGACSSTFDTRTITITPQAGAFAGNPQSVCAGSIVQLNGSVSGAATGGTWSAPGGTFSNANSLSSTYTPVITSGAVLLTLMPNVSGGCTEPSTVVITVNPAPQTTGVTICQGGTGSLVSPTVCSNGGSMAIGPNSGGAGANAAGVGTVAWNNPGNSRTNDNLDATANLSGAGITTSNYLRTTNYGFNIPGSATILGIEVRIGRHEDNIGSGTDVRDVEVRLLKAGSLVGTNKANTSSDWPTAETSALYGSASDLWGATWNASDINTFNFGVSLVANSDNNRLASVDYMNIVVSYSVNGVINWYSSSNVVTPIGTGSPFNPVGVANSGLPDTNTPGTYTFYAECSSSPGCRTATNFVINPKPTVTKPANITNSACVYANQAALNTAFTTWLSGFSVSGGAAPIGSFQGGTPSVPILCTGGAVTAVYNYTDNCETGSVSSVFTVTAPVPLITNAPGNISRLSCNFSNQAAVDADFAVWLAGFSATGGCSPAGTFSGGTPVAPPICGGSVTATYNVVDVCGSGTVTASYTIAGTSSIVLAKPADVTRPACNFASQTDLNADFATWLTGFSVSGGCAGIASYGTPVAPLLCTGGTTEVTYIYNDVCTNKTVTARYTVTIPSALIVNKPANLTTSACTYSDQGAVNTVFANWLTGFGVAGGCSPSGDYGAPVAPLICNGGTTTVTFTYSDKCENGAVTAAFTISKPSPLIVYEPAVFSAPSCNYATQADLNSAFANWLSFFYVNSGCNLSVGAFQGGTPVAPDLCGGTTTVVFNYSDLCESGSISVPFTITPPPALAITKPADYTAPAGSFATQSAANSALTAWLTGFGVTGGCSPTASFSGVTPVAPNLCGGSVSVTYNVVDRCTNGSATATFTIPTAAILTVFGPPSALQASCQTQAAINTSFTAWKNQFGFSGGNAVTASNLTAIAAPSACGGTMVVNYSATDVCGQAADKSSTFAIDIPGNVLQEPTFTVPPAITIFKDASCNYDASPIVTGSPSNLSDNCAASGNLVVSYTDAVVTGTCPSTVLITRTWKVTDNCSNVTSHIQTITVTDNSLPSIMSCPADVTAFAGSSECFATGLALGTATATDNCSVPVITNNAPVQFPVGVTSVVWTATDDCGNIATCTQKVTILDNNSPPTLICPANVTQTALAGNCSLSNVVVPDPTYSDNCGVTKLIWTMTGATTGNSPATGINKVSGQTFNVGITTVTYTAYDAAGNASVPCSFEVWIKDLNKPVLTTGCSADITAVADAGQCGAVLTIPAPAISDPCNEGYTVVNSFNNSKNASGTYPVGVTNVVWTITDASGNVTTCTQIITINDLMPSLSCPGNIVVQADFEKNFASNVVVAAPIYSDNCPGAALTWTMTGATTGNSPASGVNIVPTPNIFNVGTTTIVYTITDVNAHSLTCSFIVTVEAKPVITCQPDILKNTDAGICSALADPGMPVKNSGAEPITYSWNMTGATVASGSGAIGSFVFNKGVTTITWTATNVSGVGICTQLVTVADVEPPKFTAPGPISECVEFIREAVFDATKSDLATPRPEYFLFVPPDNRLDIIGLSDNCCAPASLIIKWRIDFQGGSPASITGAGQPSAIPSAIEFPGDLPPYNNNLVHTITYWVEDCNGNVSATQIRTITIKPRPDIIK